MGQSPEGAGGAPESKRTMRGERINGTRRAPKGNDPEGLQGSWTSRNCLGQSPEGAGGAPESKGAGGASESTQRTAYQIQSIM